MDKKERTTMLQTMLVWIATQTTRLTTAVLQPFSAASDGVNRMVHYCLIDNATGWLAIVVGDKGVKGALLEIDPETRLQVSFEGPVDGASGHSLVKQLTEYIGGAIRTAQGDVGERIGWGEKNKDGSMKQYGLMYHVGALLADMKPDAITKGGKNLLTAMLEGSFSLGISTVSGVNRYVTPMEQCADIHKFHNIAKKDADYKALASWADIRLGDYLNPNSDSYAKLADVSLADYVKTTDCSKFTFVVGAKTELKALDDTSGFFDAMSS